MPVGWYGKADYEGEKCNRRSRMEEGQKCIAEVGLPFEFVKQGIYCDCTKKRERQGRNGRSQKSQGHR